METHFIFEEKATKSPNGSKDKVELVYVFGSVRGCIVRGEQSLQQVAQSLDHAHLKGMEDYMSDNATCKVSVPLEWA